MMSAGAGRGTRYPEFRTVLTGMMEAYRAEGDMLVITKRMLDRDVFETVEMAARARGWGSRVGTCAGCRRPLLMPANEQDREQEQDGAVGVEDRGAGEPPSLGSFHPSSNVQYITCTYFGRGNWPPAQTRQNDSETAQILEYRITRVVGSTRWTFAPRGMLKESLSSRTHVPQLVLVRVLLSKTGSRP
ncbi:hypothetical protein BJV78DRAFT_1254617 [Lactifluus subvellereus]|nr:hypothetical protein BJV78DRAFT_1254617 [Lactifluus subvellereus]